MTHPRSSWQYLVWLALPFVFYLIPELSGFSWSALGENHNVLNPPEGYHGRVPDMRITVEAWGASVVAVPLHARLRQYIRSGELPLWNPHQGLGQPFAAEGEGGPYFPFAVLWALVPYAYSNYVTFLMYYAAAVFLYLFLRGLGLSGGAAIFGGMIYVLSGALSLNIARPNIADQLCMIPVLFWAAAKAMRERTVTWYAVFAAAAALHLLAGFVQIAMTTALLVGLFCVAYGWMLKGRQRRWKREALIALGALVLGNGLAAFYLWPMLEAMRITYNIRTVYTWIGFIPTPQANGIAFFLPLLFGHPSHVSWIPGVWPQVVDWDNLYGFAGTGVLLVTAGGYFALHRIPLQRRLYVFFLGSGVFLTLRYLGVAPFVVVNLLPVLEPQAPKHANGLMVYCFVVAAAFALDSVRQWDYQRGRWLLLGICGYLGTLALALIGRQGGFAAIHPADLAVRFVLVTAFLTAVIVGALRVASRWERFSGEAAVTLVTAVVLGELTVYIPLGNTSPGFLGARVGLFVLIVASGFALAMGRRWAAGAIFGTVLIGYTLLIVRPSVGLPEQFDVDTPPRFMGWLSKAAGHEYRSFGIAPDFSSIAGIQDIGTVGPLGPRGFFNFANIVSDETMLHDYLYSTHFMLAGPLTFRLEQYRRMKPVFDWLGVRHLILDKAVFHPGGRSDDRVLLESGVVRKAYEDNRVLILESTAAQPKAVFAPGVEVYRDQAAIVDRLRADPARILGAPMVEAAQVPRGALSTSPTGDDPTPLRLLAYQPSYVRIHVEAPGAGIVVLKDIDFPGWQATLNGSPANVVRVDAMVRGVIIPRGGRYVVEFVYRPEWFVRGIWLAGLTGLLVLLALVSSGVRGQWEVPRWAVLAGGVLAAAAVMSSAEAYSGGSIGHSIGSMLHHSENPEVIKDADELRVFYLESVEGQIGPGTRVAAPSGQPSWIDSGDAVLTGAGDLLRVREDGRAIRQVAGDGQRVRVVNVGMWDAARARLGGLEAEYRRGRWGVDTTPMVAANQNSGLGEGGEREPIPGFWISPGGGGYVVRRLRDAEGPYVRVEATQGSSYLVLNGQGILKTLGGMPVAIRGQIRAHSTGKATLTLYDVVAADGRAKTYTAQAAATERWTTLVVRAERVALPDPRDNFSLGILGVEAGDWFEVRELSLFVGMLP